MFRYKPDVSIRAVIIQQEIARWLPSKDWADMMLAVPKLLLAASAEL